VCLADGKTLLRALQGSSREEAKGKFTAGWEAIAIMLRIRPEQLEVFGKLSSKQFEQRMASHLRTRFAVQTAGLTDDALLGRIQVGIQKARCYGFELEPHIRSYLELSMTHGAEFDRDPKIPWAGEILRNHRLDAETKLQRLEEHDMLSHQGSA